jgi:hypothetical protein
MMTHLPLGCAPMGLKYRRIRIDHAGSAACMSRSISSIISLVRPYGFVARSGMSSVMGSLSGCPYTVADDEKTRF